MAEEVDVSALAELVRIRRDEDLLRERLEKMDERKDSVSDVVYRRVKGDYEARKGALESEARAPRERAGREYAKLRLLTTEAAKALEDARLAREEVDFRHDLGEFPEEAYAEKKSAGEQLLSERQARVDELARLKERFLEAFRSEEELERAAGPVKAAPPKPEPAAAKAEPERPSGAGAGTIKGALGELSTSAPAKEKPEPVPAPTTIMPPPATPSPGPLPHVSIPPVPPPPPMPEPGRTVLPPPPAYSPDATMAAPGRPQHTPSPDATALGVPVAVRSPEPVEHRSATLEMSVPRIVVVQDDGQGPEYVLRPEPTSIGRAPESVVRLAYPDVSRQHAMIFPVEGGFKIADRGSPNGLFVNGSRVKEHVLADGDVIQVGRRKLIFRA